MREEKTWLKHYLNVHAPSTSTAGPLVGHIDLLADRLAAQGISWVDSRIQLRLVGHFNRWLDQKGIGAEQLDEDLIEPY